MLVVVSSWNLSIFMRLIDASPQYHSNDQFDNACHVSKKYVSTGKNVSIVIAVV